MLSQRSVGIRTSALLCQLGLVTLGYWAWLYIWQSALFAEPKLLQRYLLYNEFLAFETLNREGVRNRSVIAKEVGATKRRSA